MKLGETNLVQNVNIRVFGGTDKVNSVRPIAEISKQRLGQANSMEPTTYLGETKITAIGNREFASPSR